MYAKIISKKAQHQEQDVNMLKGIGELENCVYDVPVLYNWQRLFFKYNYALKKCVNFVT